MRPFKIHTLKIGIIITLVLISLTAYSQDSSRFDLESVVINSNRIQVGFDQESANVLVINNADIKKAPVINVVDVLRYYAGIDIRQRGANGIQTDPGIRGSTFDQVLILINGIKMNDPQSGHHAMNLPVDINNVERIEIIKGPAARIYGQNAFAGAINIITKTPDHSGLNAQISGGDFGLFGGKIGGALKTGRVAQYASVSHDQSDGYKYNTDYKLTNYFYQSSIDLGRQELKILAGLSQRSFGANGFYSSESFMDQYESVNTSIVSAQYDIKKNNVSIQPRLYWRRNFDDYLFVRSNPGLYHNMHTGNTIGVEVNSSIQSKIGVTGIGLDVNQMNLESNNLGNHKRSVATLFVEQRFQLLDNKIDITPGAQLNYYSDFGLNVFPGVDLGYVFSKTFKLYSNVGYTYRVPSFTDLYYSDPANLGNPDLKPEKAISAELGLKCFSWQGLTGQLSYFTRFGKSIIDWTKNNVTDPWHPSNIANVNMHGVDFNVTLNPAQIGFANAIIGKVDVNYTYINKASLTQSENYSKYALENLRHQVSGGVTLQYFQWLEQSIYYRYSDRVNLPGYQVVDSRVNVNFKHFGGFIDVTNIFNTIYKETNLVTLPGRWFKTGITYAIQYR